MGSHVHPATIPWKIITNIWANIKSRFLQKHLPLVIIKYPINNSKKTPSTMKNLLIFTVTLLIPLCSCSQTENTDTDEPVIPPPSNNYVLQGSMQGSAELVEAGYTQIHQYMRKIGWDYSEHPNSSSLDHKDGVHGEVIYDLFIRQYIFKLSIHANEKALDGDRGKLIDRQRNEMKTQTTPSWYKLNGNWDEWQQLKWKFKIPKDFRPSGSFTHLHQLKAQEGNNGSPVITITARSNGNGSNRRIQIIHNGDTEETTKGTIIDNLPLEDFEDEWIQVYQIKMKHYKKIPISDGLHKIMQVYIKRHNIKPDEYLFTNTKGGAYRSATFRQQMIKFCQEQNIEGGEYLFKSHDYRHTVATQLYDNGVSLQGVRDYLGHDYEEMTQQYIDYIPRKIAKESTEFFKKPGNSLATCLKKGGKNG